LVDLKSIHYHLFLAFCSSNLAEKHSMEKKMDTSAMVLTGFEDSIQQLHRSSGVSTTASIIYSLHQTTSVNYFTVSPDLFHWVLGKGLRGRRLNLYLGINAKHNIQSLHGDGPNTTSSYSVWRIPSNKDLVVASSSWFRLQTAGVLGSGPSSHYQQSITSAKIGSTHRGFEVLRVHLSSSSSYAA